MPEAAATSEWRAFPNWLPGYIYLLPPGAGIRCVPTALGDKDVNPALRFHAWDQFSGVAGTAVPTWSRGGYTSVSEASGTASLEIRFLNAQSPEAPPSQGITLTVAEDIADGSNLGVLVSEVMAGRASDGDGNVLGAAIGYYLNSHGTWQYRLGGGASLVTPSPTPVGAYEQAVSAYGTHDQTGNLQEWS